MSDFSFRVSNELGLNLKFYLLESEVIEIRMEIISIVEATDFVSNISFHWRFYEDFYEDAVFPVFFFAKFELNIFINCDLSWWLKLHTKAKKIWSHRGRKSFILLSKVDRMESLNHEWSHITHSHRFIDTQADRHFYLQKFFDEFSNNKFTFYKSRYSCLCEICT